MSDQYIEIFIVVFLALGFFLMRRKQVRQKNYDLAQRHEANRLAVEHMEAIRQSAFVHEVAVSTWISTNKTKLYFNQSHGVLVVLREDQRKAVQDRQRKDEINGMVDPRNGWTFGPAPESSVFYNKEGLGRLSDVFNSNNYDMSSRKSGLFSDLYDVIVRQGNVELVHDARIFVPWVSEALYSFKEQKALMGRCDSHGDLYNLVRGPVSQMLRAAKRK